MAQFARPNADLVDGDWLNEAASATNLYASIDEVTASDSDYIESAAAPSTNAVGMSLSDPTDPLVSTGHIMRYRYQKDVASGATIDLVIQLRQGYVNEGTLGTLIKSVTLSNISNGWTDGSTTLSAGEADSITDYSDLQLRMTANQV